MRYHAAVVILAGCAAAGPVVREVTSVHPVARITARQDSNAAPSYMQSCHVTMMTEDKMKITNGPDTTGGPDVVVTATLPRSTACVCDAGAAGDYRADLEIIVGDDGKSTYECRDGADGYVRHFGTSTHGKLTTIYQDLHHYVLGSRGDCIAGRCFEQGLAGCKAAFRNALMTIGAVR